MMKQFKTYFSIIGIMFVSVFLFTHCNKAVDVNSSDKLEYRDYLSVSEDTAIVGTFSNGFPEITISSQSLEAMYNWYFETLEMDVVYEKSYIDDDLNEEEPINYLILEGHIISDGSNATVGFQITRDYVNENYIATAIFGGKWSCSGQNCTSCKPTRAGGRWSKVTGCDCNGSAGDPQKPSYCNHSTSGGGNGPAWIGVLIGIINLFG
jgi:hypothetical protein